MSSPCDPGRHILVYSGERLVVDLWGRPGVLVSLSMPPPRPDEVPVMHPFATATFMTPETEGELGELLRGSESLDAFIEAVTARGYRVDEPAT